MQPAHLKDVSNHVLALIAAGPSGRAPDLAGPLEEVQEMVRRYSAAIRRPVHIVPVPLLGAARRANNAHVLRPRTSDHGTLTFDDWLTEVRP